MELLVVASVQGKKKNEQWIKPLFVKQHSLDSIVHYSTEVILEASDGSEAHVILELK